MGGGVGDCPAATPLLKFGTFGPRYNMEKIKFKSTMPWTEYKLVMGTDTKEFWKYTNKKGEPGWMSTTNIGGEEFVINVSKKLVPHFKTGMDTTMLRISTVVWGLNEDGTEDIGTVLHLAGENNVII